MPAKKPFNKDKMICVQSASKKLHLCYPIGMALCWRTPLKTVKKPKPKKEKIKDFLYLKSVLSSENICKGCKKDFLNFYLDGFGLTVEQAKELQNLTEHKE